jgi:ribosomal protein S18 acetylase RimI-like enzyme
VSYELRVITPDDWEAFRAVRLRALADAPDAFGVTLADAAAQPPQQWRDRSAGAAGPVILAFSDHEPVAMGGLYVPPESADAFIWGMWVEPASRGHGVASRILHDLLSRPEAAGRSLHLHVTQGNDSARRLYERHGFTGTGESQPLRRGSDVRIAAMRRG